MIEAATLILSAAALVIAGLAWRNSDRNTSASTLLAIFEAFRLGWERLDESDRAKRNYHFHSLMNLFEVGSAIHQDRSVHGASKKLLEDYMCDTLTILARDPQARAEIARMRNNPNVFEHLKKFLKALRMSGRPHFIEPLVNKDAPQTQNEPVDGEAIAPSPDAPCIDAEMKGGSGEKD